MKKKIEFQEQDIYINFESRFIFYLCVRSSRLLCKYLKQFVFLANFDIVIEAEIFAHGKELEDNDPAGDDS